MQEERGAKGLLQSGGKGGARILPARKTEGSLTMLSSSNLPPSGDHCLRPGEAAQGHAFHFYSRKLSGYHIHNSFLLDSAYGDVSSAHICKSINHQVSFQAPSQGPPGMGAPKLLDTFLGDRYTNANLKPSLARTLAGPYLECELVCGPPDPVLGLQAVFPRQRHRRLVQTPVLLSLQLQNEHLQGTQDPGVSESPHTAHEAPGRWPSQGLNKSQL